MEVRKDVGLVGGCLLNAQNKITGGIYTAAGTPLYRGLHKEFSGYMHRATLRQEASVVDLRLMKVNPDLEDLVLSILNGQVSIDEDGRIKTQNLPKDTDFVGLSRKLCKAVKASGYRVVWEPDWKEKIK